MTDSNLTRLLLRKKKKKTVKKLHLGQVFQSVMSFETYYLFFLALVPTDMIEYWHITPGGGGTDLERGYGDVRP